MNRTASMNNRDSPENKPIHKGALVSCILVSIVCNLYAMLLAPNIPFIIRGYKDHVLDLLNSMLIRRFQKR